MTGQPAVSLPLFHGDDGLHLGVQLVDPPAGEAILLAVAAQLEQALPWSISAATSLQAKAGGRLEPAKEIWGFLFKRIAFDDAGGTLQVNRALSDGELATPKTRGSRRRIKLSAGSAKALKAHRKVQLEERMRKAGLWQDHDLVFPSTVGTPLYHRNVVRSFKALLKRAGLPSSIRLYDLRHTCATLLLSRNVHPKYVQELLGHASITQTLDTYSHIIEGMDGGTTDAIEEALGWVLRVRLLQRGPGHRRGLYHFPAYSAYLSGI